MPLISPAPRERGRGADQEVLLEPYPQGSVLVYAGRADGSVAREFAHLDDKLAACPTALDNADIGPQSCEDVQ